MNHKVKTILTGLLVVVALGLKLFQEFKPGLKDSDPPTSKESELRRSDDEKAGHYFVLRDCRYLDGQYNDGDSFKIRTKDGREIEVRVYFVDAPESRDKPYADHRKRVTDQGRYFGKLGYEEALALGRKAKTEAASKLKEARLNVYTSWEEVYDSGRYYAFVELPGEGWWHEYLVKNGLARIHTKGEDLPEGRSWRKQKSRLKELESRAKQSGRGGWGM